MGVRHPQLTTAEINSDLNPLVGRMASRLVKTFSPGFRGGHQARWELITEVLGFAAEAEQLLGEQRDRINQLESLTMSDELTVVGNRRGLNDFLKRALANAGRHGETGVVAFFDLDGFKKINDAHGHDLGDEVLRTVADVLAKNIRVSDFVARLGGDEFVVVLTHCNMENGSRRALELQRMINETTLPHGNHIIQLHASVGVADYSRREAVSEIIHRADEEMYRDKMTRRLIKNSPRLAS